MRKATKRTEGVSTSDLINKILYDREEYFKRNINRGYSRKEMNLGLYDYYKLKLEVLVSRIICPKKLKTAWNIWKLGLSEIYK